MRGKVFSPLYLQPGQLWIHTKYLVKTKQVNDYETLKNTSVRVLVNIRHKKLKLKKTAQNPWRPLPYTKHHDLKAR